MRHHRFDAAQLVWPVAVAFAATTAVGLTEADARVVGVPATQPKVLLDAPDDWTVVPIGSSVELRSPDKTSIVIVGVVKRAKADVIAWHEMANAKMLAFGIKFDAKAAAPPPQKTAEAPSSPPAKPVVAGQSPAQKAPGAPETPETSVKSGTAPTGPDAAAAQSPTVFSGAPTIAPPAAPPAVETAKDEQPEPDFSLEQFSATTAPTSEPRMRYKSAFLYGATLDGKPVDAQFFSFGLSEGAAFLLQQESTPADNRAVDIAKSVRRAS